MKQWILGWQRLNWGLVIWNLGMDHFYVRSTTLNQLLTFLKPLSSFVTQANNVGDVKMFQGIAPLTASGVVYVEHAMEAVKTIVGKEGYLKDLVGNSAGGWMFLDLWFHLNPKQTASDEDVLGSFSGTFLHPPYIHLQGSYCKLYGETSYGQVYRMGQWANEGAGPMP